MGLKTELILSFSTTLGEVPARRAWKYMNKNALSSLPLTGSPCEETCKAAPAASSLKRCFFDAYGKAFLL